MILYFFICLFLVAAAAAPGEITAETICEPGQHQVQDCNTCFCTSTGEWACTKMKCLRKREAVRNEVDCHNGDTTSFDNGCNTCNCYGGMWACTLKLCPELETTRSRPVSGIEKLRKREIRIPQGTCIQGDRTSFDKGCNRCVCSNGAWACTSRFCNRS